MNRNYFGDKGFESRGVLNITPYEAYALCNDGAIIIDVRENYHSFLHEFDVPQLFYCPLSELQAHIDKIPGDIPVIIADAAGLKSIEAVKLLIDNGFRNVANLAGGMLEWNREAVPVKTDKTRRISGSCMCMLKYRELKPIQLPDLDPDIKTPKTDS